MIGEGEDRAFGRVDDVTAQRARIGAVEGDLLNRLHELGVLALPDNLQPAIMYIDFQSAGRKRAAEHHAFRVVADVHKAACPRHDAAKPADIHIADCINLRRAQEGDVQAAAVIEIEHVGRIDEGRRHVRSAKGEAARGDAPNGAAFDRHNQVIDDVLLSRHRCDAFRQANAEVDNVTFLKFQCGAAGDDFALVEGMRREFRRLRRVFQQRTPD